MKKYQLRIDHILMIFSVVGASVGFYLQYRQSSLERYVVTEQIGVITELQNEIKLKPKGSYSWQSITDSNNSVYSDDYIYTGKKSFAEIKLKNGDLLKINPNTLVFISPDNKENTVSLIVYEGTANYQVKDSSEIQILNKSEQINLSVAKKSSLKKPSIKLSTKIKQKPEINFSSETIAKITTPPAPPVVSLAVVVEPPPPPPVETPVVAQKKLYNVRIPEVSADLQLPSGLARFKGAEPVLKIEWPQDRSASNYVVSVFAKGNTSIPVFKTETKKPNLLLKWKKSGDFITKVEKQVKLIARPPASVSENERGSFTFYPAQAVAAPKIKFPVENQLVIIETNTALSFNWEKSDLFTDYILTVAADPEFKTKSQEIVVSKGTPNKFNISRLPAGTWYWKIKGLSDKAESSWSRVNKFKLMQK